jgi:O-antigen ligase
MIRHRGARPDSSPDSHAGAGRDPSPGLGLAGGLGWIATGTLALTLLWAPLPFGSVVPGAALLVRLVAFLGAAVALASLAVARGSAARPARRLPADRSFWLPVAALAALGLLAALQSQLWSPSLVETVSPEHARLWRAARGVLEPGASPAPSLSLAPSETRRQAWRWLSLAAAFLAAALLGRHRSKRRVLAGAVVAAALFQVLYGARRVLVRATTIWGVEVPGLPTRLRGTFVNPNHLATCLELALPVLFAWAWWGVRKAHREVSPERRLLLVAPPAVLGVTVLTGLAFTASRGGLMGGVAGLLAMAVLGVVEGSRHSDRFRRWRRLPGVLLAVAVALGLVGWVGFERAYSRWVSTSVYEVTWGARTQVYRATWELWREFPWLGTGLGSFREAFPLVQPAAVPGTWIHAHSDVLELLATAGLVGVLCALTGLAALLLRLVRGLRRGVRKEDRATALAGLGITVSLLVHEALDFGLTMPANGFTAAVLLGVAANVPLGRPRRRSP